MNIAERTMPPHAMTTQNADMTVVGGAGHAGLPLALSFAAKGLRVNVNDINEEALEILRAGKLPFREEGGESMLTQALAERRISFTSRPSEISPSGPVIISVGTPVDEFLNPVRRVVQDCIDSLLPHLADGQLLVLRSTLYPGTTDWIGDYLTQLGRKLKVAFCPERIAQGRGIYELSRLPQLVSGTSADAEDEAAAVFAMIAPEVERLTPLEAEFAKLFNNAHRYIEFAISNQFFLIAKSQGLDYGKVLRAMKHNYPRAQSIPTAGFAAGPCLVKDTMQLLAFARNEFPLGNAALMVNEGLPLQIIGELRRRYDLSRMAVGLLGMAFKAESDDRRASLSYKFKKALTGSARRVLTTDPYVIDDPDLRPLEEVVAQSDLLILCAPHRVYATVDLQGKPVVDIWGLLKNANLIY